MVIDEIQRVPELLLAIKEQVDADPRPGRYLLTSSARLLGLRGLPDTLPGRAETIELWPLAQGELDGTADRFIDAVFERGDALTHESAVTRQEYAERIVRGGFSSTVAAGDFRSLRHLAERIGGDFLAGLVFYTGGQTLPPGLGQRHARQVLGERSPPFSTLLAVWKLTRPSPRPP